MDEGSTAAGSTNKARPQLRKNLNGWQIFFIALSAVIGTGIFSHDSLALSLAGPGGLVLATGIVGLVVIAFMDGLSELIQVFPCSNALVEYVRHFVDPDLALCVGVAYWATWAIFFSLQLGAAADFCSAWALGDPNLDITLRVVVFFMVLPAVLLWINTRNVSLFGWIETVGGFLKLFVITGLSLVLYYLAGLNEGLQLAENAAGADPVWPNGTYLDDGFTASRDFPNPVANVFAVLPIVAFSWIGVEIVAVTAFEAFKLDDLKLPSQRLPYVTLVVYLICGIGSGMAVRYNNVSVSRIYRGGDGTKLAMTSPPLESGSPVSSSGSLIVIAANQVGNYGLAQALNGFLIFSAVSAGNTGLYVASRTLYGIAFHDEHHALWIKRWLSQVNASGVPINAVFVSAFAFMWLPFLSLADIPHTKHDSKNIVRTVDAASQQFLNIAASLSALFVYGAECLAFARYYHWLKMHSGKDGLLQERYPELNRWNHGQASTLLGRLQPGVSYFGLVGCFAIVFIFPSALLWGGLPSGDGGASVAYQVLEFYLAPGLILFSWLMMKAVRYLKELPVVWWVDLSSDGGKLEEALKNLRRLSEESPGESPSSSWNERVNGGTQMEYIQRRRFESGGA